MIVLSGDRVFDRLDGTGLHGLARKLGGEGGGLLRERVDSFSRRACRTLHDDELGETRKNEHSVLLQFLVSDLRERTP